MTNPLGDTLTEAHRVQQGQIATRTALRARLNYQRMVVPRQRSTFPPFVDLTVADVMRARAQSRSASSAYYRRLRFAEAPAVDPYASLPPVETDEDIEERIRSSLYVQGRVRPERLERAGRPEERVSESARVGVMGATIRHTLNGGRDQLINEVKADAKATGFVRVTAMDNKVCWFCAMLASRVDFKDGSFEKSDPRFAIGGNPFADAKVHDSCRCMMRPLFDSNLPDRTERYIEWWYDLSGKGDGDLAENFRSGWAAMVSSTQSLW